MMKIQMRQELVVFLAMYLILLFLPVFLYKDAYVIGILITCMIWGAMASVWNFTMGYAGIFTFGQFGFFVVAAYTSGMVTKYLGISPWLGILLGGLMAAMVGVLIGLPCMKLKGAYIALITFALHLVVAPMIKVADPLGTGGSTGLMSIPSLSLGAYTFSRTDLIPWYYAVFVISFLVLLIVYKIIFSSIGLGFIGLRDSEDFAKTLGINEYKYKLLVFGLSAFLTGIMGGFYAHYAGIISPRLLGLDIFLLVMLMLIIGGIGIFPGAFLGSFIIWFLNEFLRPLEAYRFLIFGAIVVVAIKLMPEGILGNLGFFKNRLGKRLLGRPAKVESTGGQNV
ncbi:MAG: branched-chain amino acid ABC transporter permease [Desulfobacterales bacterium]|jgi:branched-chain amino acid transport system permease protein